MPRPIAEPNRKAATLIIAIAMPRPISPPALLAITAAVGGPPMRGCRLSIMLVNTMGNSAVMAQSLGRSEHGSAVGDLVVVLRRRRGFLSGGRR